MKTTTVLVVNLLILMLGCFIGFTAKSYLGEGVTWVGTDQARSKLEKYLTSQGIPVTVKGLTEAESCTYKITFDNGGQEFTTYMSSDGTRLYGSAIDLNAAPTVASSSDTQAPSPEKTDKPKVDLFVMSFCPYGNEAENTMQPVYNLLKDDVDWNIHYIVSTNGDNVNSLHGQPEVDQNMREACVLENNGLDKWWAFTTFVNTSCGSDGDCWKEAASTVGLNTDDVESCVATNGISYMKKSEEVSNEFRVSASPTLLINGVRSSAITNFGQPEAYKKAICEAFTEQPEECNTILETIGTKASSGSCN